MEDRVLKTLYKKLKGKVVRRNRIREYMEYKHIDLVTTWKHYYMEFNYRGRSLLLVNKDNYRNIWNYEDTITCAFMVYKGEVYPVNEKSKDKIIKIINKVYDKHKSYMIRNLGVDDSYFETEEDIKDDRLLMIEKLQEYKMKHNLRLSPMFDKDNPYYLRNGYNKRRKRRTQIENENIEFINNDLFRNGNMHEFGYVRILNNDDISNWTFTSNDMSDMFISNRGDIWVSPTPSQQSSLDVASDTISTPYTISSATNFVLSRDEESIQIQTEQPQQESTHIDSEPHVQRIQVEESICNSIRDDMTNDFNRIINDLINTNNNQ